MREAEAELSRVGWGQVAQRRPQEREARQPSESGGDGEVGGGPRGGEGQDVVDKRGGREPDVDPVQMEMVGDGIEAMEQLGQDDLEVGLSGEVVGELRTSSRLRSTRRCRREGRGPGSFMATTSCRAVGQMPARSMGQPLRREALLRTGLGETAFGWKTSRKRSSSICPSSRS